VVDEKMIWPDERSKVEQEYEEEDNLELERSKILPDEIE
jgi:hypothetical protein